MGIKSLTLIRHMESEGNLFNSLYRLGLLKECPPEFEKIHASEWRLTNRGVEQGKITWDWIFKNLPQVKTARKVVSPFVRTLESAKISGLDGWIQDSRIQERDWGDIQTEDKNILYPNVNRDRVAPTMFWWRPPNGETMAEVSYRVRKFWEEINQKYRGADVFVSTHGEVTFAFRYVLENMNPQQFYEMYHSKEQHIYNGSILHYTSVRPSDHSKWGDIKWMFHVCPSKGETEIKWRQLDTPVENTAAELDEIVERHPRCLENLEELAVNTKEVFNCIPK